MRCAARLDAGWSRVEAGSGVARSGSCDMTSGVIWVGPLRAAPPELPNGGYVCREERTETASLWCFFPAVARPGSRAFVLG